MIILPAIDIKDSTCVRLYQGDYSTAEKVAESPLATAKKFESAGARWIHMVDLDGAKARKPVNSRAVLEVKSGTDLKVEIGGGIRDMDTVEFYLEQGIDRVILGSAALQNPEFVREAVRKYGRSIAVGIDAIGGKAAAEGWTEKSSVDYLELAKNMEQMGVRYIIYTDISKDGTLAGPNLQQLDKINSSVSCNIIASGGVSSMEDVLNIRDMGLYGAIAGKAIYSGCLDLEEAVVSCQYIGKSFMKKDGCTDELGRYFLKGELIPAIVQEDSTGEVLMLAYMNRESLAKTFETGYTWFYSRSRKKLWNKGATSGHLQKVVSIDADCDDDTLLVKVIQKGPACHTGRHSCFFKNLI